MKPLGASPVQADLADSETVCRFAADLDRVWPEGVAQGEARLGISVSGGPDSCALLLLASAALPGRIAAATVDHGLREGSAGEARFVADLCESIGVEHAVLPVTVAAGNVQAQARAARYRALADWAGQYGIAALATAHHADDQAETLLLRLNRASGVAGLAGVRERRLAPDSDLLLLRPLLGWRRAELESVVAVAGLAAVADPSNLDDRFDRVRLRKALAGADWLDRLALAQSASHLADADEALEWAARREWHEAVRPQPFGLVYRPSAPRAVVLRVMARIIREIGVEGVRGGQVARLFDSLESGAPASIGTLVVRPEREGWAFSKAPVKQRN
ncbi:MAG: tRNA lysidine(34) synthetase TilS [Alphaproteobacteria bacterium]|nr:tRNA lysidine(34) synthetase TilS [Alphaproteobacteria bacterium]